MRFDLAIINEHQHILLIVSIFSCFGFYDQDSCRKLFFSIFDQW